MPTINYAFREIICKIVYYGPGAGGKTTNLIFVHGNVPQKHRGELVSLATEQDRTLFFDFLPLDIGDVKGYKTKFQLYTVPGQVFYNQTRKLVLRGVDGVVFVADSQSNRLQDNIDSFENLIDNLREYGMNLDNTPLVVQYNKRDLPDTTSVAELEDLLNPRQKFPFFEAIASDGKGVRETLREISSLILKKLNATANIISDEELVRERLGLKTDAELGAIAAAEEPAASGGPAGAPKLDLAQQSDLFWHGMRIGSGFATVATRSSGSNVEYMLNMNHKVLGMFVRNLSRKLSYVGDDTKLIEGIERNFHILRDASAGRESARINVRIEKGANPRLHMSYPGIAGDIKVGPEGEEPLV
jgi:mutual gliding-motility protein MglA